MRGEKQSHQDDEDSYILMKHYDTLDLPMIKRIEMLEKHNTLTTINYGTHFYILEYFIQSL